LDARDQLVAGLDRQYLLRLLKREILSDRIDIRR
jgi:hypothetical protein